MKLFSKQDITKHLRLYFVCGTTNTSDLVKTVEIALQSGATCFQFREKGKDALYGDELEAMAQTLQASCRRAGVPFIVNDDVALAIRIGADGVHVGQDDSDAALVRAQIGPDKWLGVSVHSLEEAEHAASFADYVGIGPIHATTSKSDAGEVRGTTLIREVRQHVPTLPIVAIGGIHAEDVAMILRDGADGVAVISAIASAADVASATREFVRL